MANPVDTSTPPSDSLILYLISELLDYGVVPSPRLAFADPFQTLISLKQKLLSQSSSHRVVSASLAENIWQSCRARVYYYAENTPDLLVFEIKDYRNRTDFIYSYCLLLCQKEFYNYVRSK